MKEALFFKYSFVEKQMFPFTKGESMYNFILKQIRRLYMSRERKDKECQEVIKSRLFAYILKLSAYPNSWDRKESAEIPKILTKRRE